MPEYIRGQHDQPEWGMDSIDDVVGRLSRKVALVSPEEVDKLVEGLATVTEGKAFLLQEGPSVESFDDPPSHAEDIFQQVLLPSTVALTYGAGWPVVKVVRQGQYATSPSSPTETRGDITLPSYLGDMVNGKEFSVEARKADPHRLITAYYNSMATLFLLKHVAKSKIADLTQVHEWNVAYCETEDEARFRQTVDNVTRTLNFMEAIEIDLSDANFREAVFFTSHDCRILDYELPLTRQDDGGRYYASSGHMLLVDEQTSGIDDDLVAYCAEVKNPVGVMLGKNATPDNVSRLSEALNPDNIPGKLTLVTRMGSEVIGDRLPEIIEAVRFAGRCVVWSCDPMHANSILDDSQEIRSIERIFSETDSFFEICRAESVWPGGVHLEVSGQDVTGSLSGSEMKKLALSVAFHATDLLIQLTAN